MSYKGGSFLLCQVFESKSVHTSKSSSPTQSLVLRLKFWSKLCKTVCSSQFKCWCWCRTSLTWYIKDICRLEVTWGKTGSSDSSLAVHGHNVDEFVKKWQLTKEWHLWPVRWPIEIFSFNFISGRCRYTHSDNRFVSTNHIYYKLWILLMWKTNLLNDMNKRVWPLLIWKSSDISSWILWRHPRKPTW